MTMTPSVCPAILATPTATNITRRTWKTGPTATSPSSIQERIKKRVIRLEGRRGHGESRSCRGKGDGRGGRAMPVENETLAKAVVILLRQDCRKVI